MGDGADDGGLFALYEAYGGFGTCGEKVFAEEALLDVGILGYDVLTDELFVVEIERLGRVVGEGAVCEAGKVFGILYAVAVGMVVHHLACADSSQGVYLPEDYSACGCGSEEVGVVGAAHGIDVGELCGEPSDKLGA